MENKKHDFKIGDEVTIDNLTVVDNWVFELKKGDKGVIKKFKECGCCCMVNIKGKQFPMNFQQLTKADEVNQDNKFTLGDLESGMLVLTRNNNIYIVIADTIQKQGSYTRLSSSYNQDMTCNFNNEFDIMKVYKPSNAKEIRRAFNLIVDNEPNVFTSNIEVVYDRKEAKKIDWSNIEVNTPVYVKHFEQQKNWDKRHFAKFENGKLYTWEDGKTSFTTEKMIEWDFAKLMDNNYER